MFVATEDQVLKVGTGFSGEVWYLDGDRYPESSGVGPERFMGHDVCRRARRVRVVGSARNADLIVRLYARRVADELESLEVCGPIFNRQGKRYDGTMWDECPGTLYGMRLFREAGSRGGWHEFGPKDYPTYAMASCLQREVEPEFLLAFLRNHPVWPALSALPYLDPLSLCKVLVEVMDPRFTVDGLHPDRSTIFCTRLGLWPDAQRDLDVLPDHRTKRICRLVRDCWKTAEPSSAEVEQPAFFLWRECYRHDPSWKGDLRASQLFARLLRLVWLDGLYDRKPWGEPLFVPAYFFSGREEAVGPWLQAYLNRFNH